MTMQSIRPNRIWDKSGEGFGVQEFCDLPIGYRTSARTCPRCGSERISGAIIVDHNFAKVVPSADGTDPNVVCLDCGFWADAF